MRSAESQIAQGKADFESVALLGIAVGYEVAPPGQPQLKAIVLICQPQPGSQRLEVAADNLILVSPFIDTNHS